VIIDLFLKQGENIVEIDEFFKSFRLCFINKIHMKRFSDIINFKFINSKNKITKGELYDICIENEELTEILFKNFHNSEEIETIFDDQIYIMCDSNLKKSKY
jgi:hypothetical protein